MQDDKRYWLPAKRYGWGWELPTTLQGWMVLALFALLLLGGAVLLLPSHGPSMFVAYSAILSALLVGSAGSKASRPVGIGAASDSDA